MTGTIAPAPKHAFYDNNGDPLTGAKLFCYAAGTTTKQDTYTDADLLVPNANPVILDSAGRCTLFLPPGLAYKFVLAPATDTDPPASPIWSVDNVLSVPTSSSSLETSGTLGENVTTGQPCYLSDGSGGKTTGRWYLTDARQTYSSTNAPVIGFAQSSGLAGAIVSFRISGQVTGLVGLSPGALYYVSETPGALTTTAPAYAAPVGTANSATTLIVSHWTTAQDLHANLQAMDAAAFTGNLVRDSTTEIWAVSTDPAHFTRSGAGSSSAKVAGSIGANAWEITAGGGAVAVGAQTIISAAMFTAYWKGKAFSLSAFGISAAAGRFRPWIDDGGGKVYGSYNAGASLERVGVTRVLDASSASKLQVGVELPATRVATIHGWVLVRGVLQPLRWSADPTTVVVITIPLPGTAATGTTLAGIRYDVPVPLIGLQTRLRAGTAPTGQALIVDINKNGTSMYTSGGRPRILAAASTGVADFDASAYDARCLARGDYLTVDIDQVGNVVEGADLMVQILGRVHPAMLGQWVAPGDIG